MTYLLRSFSPHSWRAGVVSLRNTCEEIDLASHEVFSHELKAVNCDIRPCKESSL
jgi:hypothetical protein